MTKLVEGFAFGESGSGTTVEPGFASSGMKPIAAETDSEDAIRVLIIDDDPEILENLHDSLAIPVFEVRTTDRAQVFYALLDGFAPDIVISDMAMPEHDGMDVLRTLRDNRFAGEVVIMSGAEGQVLETARRLAGSYGLNIIGALRKPFARKELLTLLNPEGDDGKTPDGDMSNALSKRRIRPYFQPKVDLKTGSIVGAEALSRWYHPKRGLLMPQTYLKGKRAQSRNSVHDYTILERAVEFCGKLNAIGHRIGIAVNFATDVLLTKEFLEVLADVQQRHKIAPEQLFVELNEDDAAENDEELAERLLKLRLFGAHLSIDHFGTGHSSLTRIRNLPVSEIKIDQSFIRGLTEDSTNLAIVKSIIDLAHSMHCPVVAEGVEAVETLDALRKIGCDLVQGYLFSPAVNETTFVALVRDGAFNFLKEEAVENG